MNAEDIANYKIAYYNMANKKLNYKEIDGKDILCSEEEKAQAIKETADVALKKIQRISSEFDPDIFILQQQPLGDNEAESFSHLKRCYSFLNQRGYSFTNENKAEVIAYKTQRFCAEIFSESNCQVSPLILDLKDKEKHIALRVASHQMKSFNCLEYIEDKLHLIARKDLESKRNLFSFDENSVFSDLEKTLELAKKRVESIDQEDKNLKKNLAAMLTKPFDQKFRSSKAYDSMPDLNVYAGAFNASFAKNSLHRERFDCFLKDPSWKYDRDDIDFPSTVDNRNFSPKNRSKLNAQEKSIFIKAIEEHLLKSEIEGLESRFFSKLLYNCKKIFTDGGIDKKAIRKIKLIAKEHVEKYNEALENDGKRKFEYLFARSRPGYQLKISHSYLPNINSQDLLTEEQDYSLPSLATIEILR